MHPQESAKNTNSVGSILGSVDISCVSRVGATTIETSTDPNSALADALGFAMVQRNMIWSVWVLPTGCWGE